MALILLRLGLSRALSATTKTTTTTATAAAYGAGQITVLEGLEAVRKRPGMYIGSTGPRGLHHLIFEILDNAMDEVMGGHASKVDVTLHGNGSCSVSDDGRGIPCDTHPQTGKSALETVLCVLHAGGKFGGSNSGYRVSGGLHGVGLSVVNALSRDMEVEVMRDAERFRMRFAAGNPASSLEKCGDFSSEEGGGGTRVTFSPDPLIFESTEFDAEVVAARLEELAYLNAGATLVLSDERSGGQSRGRREFRHDGGISEFADSLCAGKSLLHPAFEGFVATGSRNDVDVSCALRWSADQFTDVVVSFANGIRTADGGTHVEGLRATLTRGINSAAKKAGKLQTNIPGEYVREGLTAVLVVRVPEPEFEGQTKSRLGSPGVRPIVDAVVGEAVSKLFEWQPKALAAVLDKAQAAQRAAAAAKSARDLVRRKTLLASTVLPGKLADCSSKSSSDAEIFIVEGDSAAGSAKQGRDRATQAILPLRGKILNVEKCATDKIYKNAELQALMAALGLGVKGEDYKLRYDRIVIMTDADVDGAHIRALILTFFYRYQRDLVHDGHVYIACPPLYKIGKNVYSWSDEDLAAQLEKTPNAPVQRFKGLGEMMPAQLWETTMDPARRKLQRVDVQDAAQADRIISLLMGDSAAERKSYITAKSTNFALTDIDV
ncbi:hypothetical protein CTAYLR_001638 [Chrysophaeum taylorii]|uniref:DNA topoisomerase 2 n=1 Tax=Chrysophaeum taylorii TaxID=2483200 RepID=A0AAD7XJX3_9STRA|nr:hypothetical protein CTAYLR_001638 [Chrysophaeum taylorii]